MGPADCRHTNVTMVDGRPIVDGMAKQCNACGFLVHETFDEREQAIRADERAKVEREVVAYLYEQATHWRDDDGESARVREGARRDRRGRRADDRRG